MQVHKNVSLLLSFAGLVATFVVINSASYILMLPRFYGGHPTYYPFLVSTLCAVVLAIFLTRRSIDVNRRMPARIMLYLLSAFIVGSAVAFLSLFIIVNTLGS